MTAAGTLVVKMIIAAFSGMGAATLCHPLDVIRVQMQTEGGDYKNPLDCATQIATQEGLVNGLYAGISAAYLRQWLYGSCRIGIYAFLLEQAQTKNLQAGLPKDAIPLASKMLMGLTSGGIGSFVGTPSELALVRMSADSKLPSKDRHSYKSVGDCVSRIAREEGVPQLWTGAKVTVLRAMVLSACAMGMTSDIKQRLITSQVFGSDGQMYQGLPLLFCATLVSSFVANTFANPLDVVKSRMQNQRAGTDGSLKYKSMVDCFVKILADEGFVTFWSGFVPAFLKLAPYTVISLILTEKITMMVTGKGAL